MVGVPGKFKGCHTCRGRRVKCDMGRPACKKCADSNRVCEGYEKQMTFIVSGPNELGRCSSHPHRSILQANSKKNDATPTQKRMSALATVPVAALWTSQLPQKEVVAGENNSCVFLHTNSLAFYPQYDSQGDISLTLPRLTSSLPILDPLHAGYEYCVRAFTFTEERKRPSDDSDENPRARKRHTRHEPTSAPHQEEEKPKTLYVFSSISQNSDEYFFKHIGGTSNEVKLRGPAAFHQNPAHHFFARMWRPLATTHALRQQQSTPLEHDVWCTGPFEKTDKSAFDKLWDVIARVPAICERARRTLDTSNISNVNYIMRAKKAEDLLKNGCGQIQADFDAWLQKLQGDVVESTQESLLYWPARSSSQNTKRRSSASTSSAFPSHQFRNAETAQLLVTYWSALITFHKVVFELLVVAETPQQQGDCSHSQFAYRPSADTSPAYNSSSPQASMSSVSATSPPVSINTSNYRTCSLLNTTQSYAYDTSTTGTSLNPQYAPNFFLPQQQAPYINFHADTYPTTTGYEVRSIYAPDSGYPDLFEPPMSMSTLGQVDNCFDFNELADFNADSTPSYLNPNQMDHLPPPQRNHTPSSYISIASGPGSHRSNISAPESYQSHQSPANSFVSDAVVNNVGSHAATPPDHNNIQSGSGYQTESCAAAYAGGFPSLYQNSRPHILARFARLIGAGLDFLLSSQNDTEVVLLLWPLEVLEGMCASTDERIHCGGLRNEMERRTEEIERWVKGRRWRAVAAGGGE